MSTEMSTEMNTEMNAEAPAKSAPKRARKTHAAPKENAQASYTAKDVDMNQYITVRNGYPGQLVYTSKRTGEKFFWEHYGDEQDIQLMELRNARNTSKKFFDHNWFVFDEEHDWVIDFLGVRAFYNNIINQEGIDALFKKSPKQIGTELAALTNGQKRTVAYRAMEMIRNKEIDSLSVIEVLEKGLGVALIER